MNRLPLGVIAGLDPAIHPEPDAAFACAMDARVKPAHDGIGWGGALRHRSLVTATGHLSNREIAR
jgi:hypothetical protein